MRPFQSSLCCLLLFASQAPLMADSLEQVLREGRYAEALKLIDAGLKDHPGDLRLMTARGFALGGMKQRRQSLEQFEAVLRIRPDFVPALRGASQITYAERDPRAAHFLNRLIEFDPSDATAHSMAGVLAFEAADCASAARHFEAGRAETEANPQAYALYGACLAKLGRPKEAVPVFERLRRDDPRSATILRSLASAQAAAGAPESAASTLEKALELTPDEQTYVELAALCIVNNAPERALTAVQAGIAKLPGSARLHSIRGVVEAERGLQAEAEKDFELANQLDPKQQYGSPGLGVLYTDMGRSADAAAVLRSRIQKDPSDPTLNYLLAQAILRDGAAPGSTEFREAEAALILATHAQPAYAAAHTALGKLYHKAGDDTRAITELQIAVKLDGNDRAALNQLAGLLQRLGRFDESAAVAARLRRVVLGSPENTPAP